MRRKLLLWSTIARLHSPWGFLLLYWPCAWGLSLQTHLPFAETVSLYGFLALGALLARSAGCCLNDFIDRNYDEHIPRTAQRPLAQKTLSPLEALALSFFFFTLCLALLFTALPAQVWLLTLLVVPLVILYPFLKRFVSWAQAGLGIVFNWGALIGYVAATKSLDLSAFLLFIAGFFWTMAYDTLYAHMDSKADQKIGLKSTALLFQHCLKPALALFYLLTLLALLAAALTQGHNPLMTALLFSPLALFFIASLLPTLTPQSCWRLFQCHALLTAYPALVFLLLKT